MYRGTTPSIILKITGLSEIELDKIYVTIEQRAVVIEKNNDEIEINGDVAKFSLTQKETLSLTAGINARLQVRALSKSDVAYASQILALPVDDILKDGAIS